MSKEEGVSINALDKLCLVTIVHPYHLISIVEMVGQNVTLQEQIQLGTSVRHRADLLPDGLQLCTKVNTFIVL